ncbi:MAG: SpoIIE family protein phosphatase [Acidocella sp.]|nr:SpoIIE family protein phosphatase [Acidocella sp.]
MEQDDDSVEQTVVGRSIIAPVPVVEFGHFLSFTVTDVFSRVQIAQGGATIGRTAPAEVVIASPEVSRRHCRIEIQGDYAILTDLGSTNGTRIDGVRLERPTRLLSGVQFTLGSLVVRYERRDSREVADEAELSADLKRAEDYVRAILPQPITEGPIRTEWCFIPSTKLGGDAFGYQYLNETTFTGFLLDVSGHGIGSAMHAANVANTLRRRALPGVDFHDPAKVAAGVNEVFPMEEHNGLMFSLWCFSYDLPSRQLTFCAAGHHPSFLVVPEAAEATNLWQRSPVIGMLPFGKWVNGTAQMPPGAKLFVFSDGAFEIVSADGDQWSMENLRSILMQPAIPGMDEPQRLFKAVRAASRPGPLDDDFSVMMVTFE